MSYVELSFVHHTFWMNFIPIPTARPIPRVPRVARAIDPPVTTAAPVVAATDKDYATAIPLAIADRVPKKIESNDFPVSI